MSRVRNGKHMELSLAYAAENGWSVSRTGGDHLRFEKPGCRPVFGSISPGCHHADRNTLSRLKRHEKESA